MEENAVKKLRKALGISQKIFALRLCLSKSYISALEKDQRPLSPRLIKLISETFSVNPDFLTQHSGEMFITEDQKKALDSDNLEFLSLYNQLCPELKVFARKVLKDLLEVNQAPPAAKD
jgi:transcriptional regulator with XRE-family HTH domain